MSQTTEKASQGRTYTADRSHPRSIDFFSVGRTLFAVFMLCSIVEAQDERATVRDKHLRRPAIVTPQPVDPLIQSEVSLCVMVEDKQGVFLVHLGATPVDDPLINPGYLAYWKDEAELNLYVYGRLLFEVGDVGLAVMNLERDLGVASGELAAGIEALEDGVAEVESQGEDATIWREATYELLFELMGFDPESESDDGADGIAAPPPYVCASGFSPPPPCGSGLNLGRSPDKVIREAFGAVGCVGPPPPPGGCTGLCCVNCSDGNPCTTDGCNTASGCYHIPNSGGSCADDLNPCTSDVCSNGSCTHPPISGPQCQDDGNPCTNDVCRNGSCTHPPISGPQCLDDGKPCTDDVCNGSGICTHPPRTGACDINDCWDSEYCLNGTCVPAGWVCEDETVCMSVRCEVTISKFCIVTNSCREHCVYTLADELCDDDNVCTLDSCTEGGCAYVNISGPCTSDGNPCTGDYCQDGACYPPFNAPCSDGDECTDDVCANRVCVGTSISCNDGNSCTVDSCNSASGCLHVLMDCNDNDACTVNDRCESGLCVGDPRDCADSDPCTPDSCVNGACVHGHSNCEDAEDPCNPAPVVNFYPQCDNCTVTITVPSTLRINCDDDDGNGVSDYQQIGPIVGENDLVQASLTWTAGCAQMAGAGQSVKWRIAEGQGNRTYRVYRNPNKTEPVDSLSGYNSWPPPSTVWLEGIAPTEQCPSRFVVWVAVTYPTGGACVYCGYEGQRMTVDGPVLEWEKSAADSADLDACPNNGGLRIFPDKLSPGDQTPTIRRQVKLTTTIDPPVGGVMVYFKVFDVDDPFDQLNPSMPDVSLIDSNPTSGPDNRPPPGEAPWPASDATDANGKAEVTFTVSMQPGNNYRAVASRSSAAVAQVTQTDADAINARNPLFPGASVRGCFDPLIWSPMLTVWRKLHVETDTMVRPTFVQNTFTMPWNEPRPGAAATQVVLDVDDPAGNPFQTNDEQFTNGYAEVKNSQGNTIVVAPIVAFSNNAFGDDALTINVSSCGNNTSGFACLGGVTSGTITLSDDDLSAQAVFNAKLWGCDNFYAGGGNALLPPDLSALQSMYRFAFIEPVHEPAVSGVGGLTTFLRNQSFKLGGNYGKAVWDQAVPALRGLPLSTANYWTVMVLATWQPEEGSDFDPNAEAGSGSSGISWGISTHDEGQTTSSLGMAYTGLCTVFRAVTGEVPGREPYTVAHEIGHTLGLPHNVFQEFGTDGIGVPIGLMDPTGDGQLLPLTAQNLARLRSYVQP